jgi:hypothetical protein
MSHPYPGEAAPLTEAAATTMSGLLVQAERDRDEIVQQRTDLDKRLTIMDSDYERGRAALVAEIDATTTISAELDGTINRYRARLGPDGERAVQERAWSGPETGTWQRDFVAESSPNRLNAADPLGLEQGAER